METRSKKRQREIEELEQKVKKISKKNNDEDSEENIEEDSSESDNNSSDSEDSGDDSSEYEDFDEEMILNKLKEEDNEAYENFILVKKEIEENTPDIKNILKKNMRLKDKAKLVELYELYMMTPPMVEDHLLLKYRINKLIKKYSKDYENISKYSEKEIDDLKEKSKTLKKSNASSKVYLKHKILNLNTSQENIKSIYRRFISFKDNEADDSESSKLKTWLKYATNLPFDNVKMLPQDINISNFLKTILYKLNSELYGMDNVKEQLLIFLNAKLRNPEMTGCSLGLVGPPGVGKTSIARYISQALEWPFEQISFGGVHSVDFLKGHDYTYVGSKPGEIVKCLSNMEYKNGIMFFDEFEKISKNKDIISVLLHVTDPQQNHDYHDNYLSEVSIDLSKLWFIYSMNSLPEDKALQDRLYTIEVPPYKTSEKVNILIEYILPKLLNNMKLKTGDIVISTQNAKYLIEKIDDNNSGIRNIEKTMKDIINKIHFVTQNPDDNDIYRFMSFDVSKNLSYPVELNKDLIDDLCKKIPINISLQAMYI